MHIPQILIVEDERIVAEDLKETLNELGYKVLDIESTGEMAVTKARRLKPDLILMDIMLQGKMNGIQAAYRIGNKSNVPIIYLTAYSDQKTVNDAIITNPFGYLRKPFKKEELHESIETAIQKSWGNRKFKTKKPAVRSDAGASGSNSSIDSNAGSTAVKTQQTGNDQPYQNLLRPLEKQNINLLGLIREVEEENISQMKLNILIEFSYKLAVFNVRRNVNKIYNLNRNGDYSIDDIAIEAISTLFIINEKRNMLNLRYSILTWKNPLSTDTDALFFLNKIVSMRVNQFLYKLLKESDPLFSKILDAVNHCIKKNSYKKVTSFGKVFIVPDHVDEVIGETISGEELAQLPFNFDCSKNDLLGKIFGYIEKETDYFGAIPLNALVKRILQNYQASFNNFSQHESSQIETICVEDIMEKAILKTLRKLKSTYVEKDKVTQKEAELISLCVIDIANDMKEGQLNWGIYYYLESHMNGLTKECYKENYQNLLEYLVKKLKFYIKEQIN